MHCAACCLVPGEAEFRSRNTLPGRMCGATASATASVFEAVTAEISNVDFAHRPATPSQASMPNAAAWASGSSRCAGSSNFRSQVPVQTAPGFSPAEKVRPTSP